MKGRKAVLATLIVVALGGTVAVMASGNIGASKPTPGASTQREVTPTASTTPTPSPQARSQGAKPTAANTGVPDGLTLRPYTGDLELDVDNRTIEGVSFGGYLKLSGSNITLRNCSLQGMVFLGPGPLTIDHCDGVGTIAIDASYRDVQDVVINGYHGVMGDHDGIDVYSHERGRVTAVVIQNTLLDGQDFPPSSKGHGDGVQLRGVKDFTLKNTVIDLGPNQPQKNAAFYAELAGYGLDGLTLDTVWLNGGGYTFYTNRVTNSIARHVRIGPTHRYSEFERTRGRGWVFDDVTDANGRQISAP